MEPALDITKARTAIRDSFSRDWRIPIRKGFLYIQTEDIQTVPLVPNPVQNELIDLIWHKWVRNEPIRIIIPKPRRDGISTICEAIIYSITAFCSSYSSFILGYDDDNAKTIFEMTKRIHANMEIFVRTQTKASNAKEIVFSETDSKIQIGSAQKGDIRGKGIHAFHGSEVAYYPNAKKILGSLLPSIPNKPRTIILMESTGNGVNNWFERTCRLAQAGKSEYTLFFIPWWKSAKNSMPLPEGYELISEDSGRYGNEVKEREQYNLTDEQLYWRRYTIDNICDGDLVFFRQEYPANLDECFMGSGTPVFDHDKLAIIQRDAELAKWYGVIHGNKIEISKKRHGWLWIWDKPISGFNNRYVCSVDTGGVHEGADFSVAYMRDRLTTRTVARIYGHFESYEFAGFLVTLCKYYHNALLAIETNKWESEADDTGLAIIDRAQNEHKYNNFYTREVKEELTDQTTTRIGWNTNKKTKAIIVDCLKEFVNEYESQKTQFNDYELIEEMKTYIIQRTPKTGKVTWGAAEGKKDDKVMAYGIGLVVSKTMGAVLPVDDSEGKPTTDPIKALM